MRERREAEKRSAALSRFHLLSRRLEKARDQGELRESGREIESAASENIEPVGNEKKDCWN